MAPQAYSAGPYVFLVDTRWSWLRVGVHVGFVVRSWGLLFKA